MSRQRLLAVVLVCLLALAGCTGADGPTATGPETNESAAPENSSTEPGADDPSGDLPAARSAEDVFVFDHGGTAGPVVEGGLAYDPQNTSTRRYATVLDARTLDRLNTTLLERLAPNATAFVDETTLSEQRLLVYQETPASSFPDYRLTSIEQANGSLVVALNDSARGGTADITVETVLVRIPTSESKNTVVRLEDGTEVGVEAS